MQIKSLANLEEIRADYQKKIKLLKREIVICAGTGCTANGSLKVYEEIKKQVAAAGLNLVVRLDFDENIKEPNYVMHSGCQGFCQMGPLVTIEPDHIQYVHVKKKNINKKY